MHGIGPEEIRIRRLTVNLEVPRDQVVPARAQWQLDDIAGSGLAPALGQLLAPLARAHSDEIVFVQRLAVDVELDLAREPARLAERWAAYLAAGVAAVLADKETGDRLVRFRDATAYLASFVADLAGGTAWGRWYYRPFEGLRALPAAAAIRTAVLEQPDHGVAALATLPPHQLGAVLSVLGAIEARRIVEEIGAGAGQGALDRAAQGLLAALPAWRGLVARAADVWPAGLGLFLVAAPALEPAVWPSAVRLAVALALWESVLSGASATAAERAVSRVLHGAGSAAAPIDGDTAQAALVLAPLLSLSRAQRQQLGTALAPPSIRKPSPAAATIAQTPFGGMLLLLPHLGALPLERACPRPRDRAVVRLLVLGLCAGQERAPRVWCDPVLRGILGVPSGLEVREALAEVRPTLSVLAADLAVTARAGAASLVVTPARAAGRAWLVAIAGAPPAPVGPWVLVRPLDGPGRLRLRAGELCGLAGEGMGAEAPPAERSSSLAAARRVSAALAYLRLPDGLPGLEAEWTLGIAAQQVLGAFARRLPGFAASSPRFVHDSFLAFSATVEEADGRRLCQLGRPPLAALLTLTGVLRGTIATPWRQGPPLELFPVR